MVINNSYNSSVISAGRATGTFIFPVKKGLLYKATLKEKQTSDTAAEDRGITSEEVREVQAQIEEIIHKKRTAMDMRAVGVTHRKGELTFPLIINTLVVIVSVAVILGISYMVNREEVSAAAAGSAFSSVEGHLIRQLRQDADNQLSEKDKEIEDIRKKLAAIEQEQTNAAAQFQSKYQAKELDFKKSLEQDIGIERERLIGQGVSMEQIDELLSLYEKERFTFYQEELNKYRQQLEAERLASEAQYQRLQEQYQSDIRTMNEERRLIQEGLREQEQKIRATQTGRASEGGADMEQAKEKLAALADRRNQSQLEENQITGMFNQVRTALQQERYPEALNLSESLVRHLDGLPQDAQGSQQRRSLDIYLASSLARIARTELDRVLERNVESGELRDKITALTNENLRLTQVNQELSRALEQARQQESELAAQKDTVIANLTARIGQLESENTQLNQLKQDLSQSADNNRRNEAELATLNKRIADLQAENAQLNKSNQDLSQNADRNRQNEAELAALNKKIAELEAENTRLTQANQGLTWNADNQKQQNQEDAAAFNKRIAELQAENTRLTQANQDLARDNQQQNQEDAAAFNKRIAELQADNARLTQANQEETAALNKRIAELEADNAQLNKSNLDLTQNTSRNEEETAALNKKIAELEAENARLTQVNQDQDKEDLIEKIAKLETENARLSEMIKAAHKEGIANVTNILEVSLRVKNTETRKTYLESMKPRYSGEPDILAFIDLLITRL